MIDGQNRVAPAGLAAVLAEECACGGIEQADVMLVPLDGDRAPEPAGRRRVVGAGHFDAAIEMHGAGPVLVIAKRLDRQGAQDRLLLGEHGGDLTLGGAVDAGVGPARLPAIEIGLGLVERLEAQPLERRFLGMADGRLYLALLESCRLQPVSLIRRRF